MKTKLLTFAVLLCAFSIKAQDASQNDSLLSKERRAELYNMVLTNTKTKLDEYCELIAGQKNRYKAADKLAFVKQFKTIFGTVIINNTDIVNNGSAFGYSYNEDKHKFSANMAFSKESWNRFVLDIGTNITNVNDDFKYYTDGAWANDIGLRIGFNYAFAQKQFIYPSNCEITKEKRELYVAEKINELKEAIMLGKNSNELEVIRDRLKENLRDGLALEATYNEADKKKIEKLNKQIELLKKFEKLNKKEKEKKEKEIIAALTKYYKTLNIFDLNTLGLPGTTEPDYIIENIDNYTSELLTEFDMKNNDFHGYSVWWVNANANISNNTFKMSNDSIIDSSIQEKYGNLMKLSFEGSLNYNRNGSRLLMFAKAYGKFNRGSFLDAPNLKDTKLTIVQDASNPNDVHYNIQDEEGNVIQRYENIRDAKYNVDLGTYLTTFFMFDKTLGLTGKANFNFPSGSNLEMNYKPNYSATVGAAFRVASKEWSKATFTINAGFENVLYDVNAFDFFMVKASIGLPFSIFEKKKE
ncbi:hypothetical protein [Flavobacterium sp.]|uniref:hypothetical protein n=1 Tax=Flavobacterium sp. TaxID=239 RepID=UPI003A8F98DD